MRFGRAILMAALAVALAAYAFDCAGMTTPRQAMQCCKTMPCSPAGHGSQDCCQKMPAMHSPFVRTPSIGVAGFSLSALAVLPASREANRGTLTARAISTRCHAPPGSELPASTPLRI
ncbi:MAG TPA: hypothetical protein VN661_02055 [Candidatus Acidoferrales bacterium]|nr:hypothetical protein [Candidatus Acidoferrales bacterium]